MISYNIGQTKIISNIYNGAEVVSCCGLTRKPTEWTIFQWKTYGPKHQGFGKQAMQELFQYCIDLFGRPEIVKYIWNGQNEYVGQWLSNFDAVNACPLAVLKNNAEDDWESHIYKLDTQKFLDYILRK